MYCNRPDLFGRSSFSAASSCPLSGRGTGVGPGLCARWGCGVSDLCSGCHRDQPAEERQCLSGGAEVLSVLQPPVETAALVGSLRVGGHGRLTRSTSQCFFSSYQVNNCHGILGLFHIEIQSNLEKIWRCQMEIVVFLASHPSLAPDLHHPATEGLCRPKKPRFRVSASCHQLAESKPLSHLPHLLFHLCKSRSPSLASPIPPSLSVFPPLSSAPASSQGQACFETNLSFGLSQSS